MFALFTDIANAIRAKLGTNNTYTIAEMADAIRSIDRGGLITKTVTSNGTYKASDEGAYGYSRITVNVGVNE